jgi:hypothetical protein
MLSVRAPLALGYWKEPYVKDKSVVHYDPEMATKHRARLEARAREVAWPDERSFVDPSWAAEERERVARYLEVWTLVNVELGISDCRFCKQENGTGALTDGAFCWPEGLPHYVWEHEVRLPTPFVEHVFSDLFPADTVRPHFDKLGQRDRSFSDPERSRAPWTPRRYGSQLIDPTWCRAQTGWDSTAR